MCVGGDGIRVMKGDGDSKIEVYRHRARSQKSSRERRAPTRELCRVWQSRGTGTPALTAWRDEENEMGGGGTITSSKDVDEGNIQ